MAKNIKIQTNLKCSLVGTEHFIEDPRKLTCGKTHCLKCLEIKSNEKNEYNCIYCKKKHLIDSDLRKDMMVKYCLEENLENIVKYLKNKLNVKLNELIIRSDKSSLFENLFEYMSENIQIRIESINRDFEILETDLIAKIDNFKRTQTVKNQVYKNQLRDFLKERVDLSNLDNIINDLKITDNKSYIVSNLKLDNVGLLKNPFDVKKYATILSEPIIVDLKINSNDVCCFVYDKYIFIDNQNNLLCLMDKNYHIIRKIDKIEDTKLKNLSFLCYSKENLFVCIENSEGKTQVIGISKNLDKILMEFESEYVKEILAMNVIDNNLFIFQTDSFIIIDIETKFIAKKNNFPKINSKIYSSSITSNLVALNIDNRKIELYDTEENSFRTVLCKDSDNEKLYGIYLQSNFLVVHLNDGFKNYFQGYEFNMLSKDWNLLFKKDINVLDNSIIGSWCLKFENNRLFGCFWGRKLIILE